MSAQWIAVIGTSAFAFGLKFLGHSVPERYLRNERMTRINALVPIVLLSALVAIQTFTIKTKLLIDHRAAGVLVALIALKLKAPFPIVVIGAALTSALLFHFA